ncbi:hypothetical protein [Amnibacterium setariae]|uniref:Uncharacterized protein n=1 Tax=Amnibacterium setariae TaxID=2306585 RepID=A0A3A1U1S8_9MICO|nr:hypothetical protein [Amnibacterium setariae]RIX30814.1 hypothetical protein D1781_05300 [Amnibacterium setariae]
MGLIAALAVLRVAVLVVELPGRPLLRLRAEAAVRARGWTVVSRPEDADLVLVCGTPRPEVAAAVDDLWSRVPVPRARRTVRTAEQLPDALDSAARVLADTALQRRTAAEAPPLVRAAAAPGACALARDWPAGLLLDCAVDRAGRITAVGERRLPAEPEDDPLPDPAVLLAIADAAGLLRLAGLPALALRLDRVVDLALGGRDLGALRPRVRRVAAAVRRSASLARLLRHDTPGVDVRARLLALLEPEGDAVATPSKRRLIGRPAAALPLLVAATEPVPGDA